MRSRLLLDGESVYSLVANPLLLLLARVILVVASPRMSSLQVSLPLPAATSSVLFDMS